MALWEEETGKCLKCLGRTRLKFLERTEIVKEYGGQDFKFDVIEKE